MAIFEIQGPDGQTYEVDAPDEASAVAGFKRFSAPASAAPKGRHLSYEEGLAELEKENQAGPMGAATAALTGAVDGVPVVGPLALGGAQRGAAAITSLINGSSYDDNVKHAQGITTAAQDAHPYVTAGANVTGAVGGTLPMIAAAPAAFGAGTAGIGVRSIMSALSGSVLGGADAGVRSGGDVDEVKKGVMIGGGTGAIGPAAGKLIGSGAQSIWNALTNRSAAQTAGTTSRAVKEIAALAERDGLDASAVRQKLQDLGPEGMLMDLGPGLQGRAGGIAATPGRGQSLVRDALADRQSGANARIGQTVDETLGPNVVPSQVDATIAGNQVAMSPAYRDAFAEARPYDVSPIADDIDRSVGRLRGPAQTALRRVRGMLNIEGTEQLSSDPSVMFQTRQAIDGMLSGEVDPKVISALAETRQAIDDGLTRAVPRIKEADASYAELARQREALQRGQSVLSSGRESPRPAELAQEVQQGALPQGMQIGPSAAPFRLSQGARAEVDRIVGTNANDIVALNRLIKGEGDWNRDRLTTLFGEEKAGRLFKVLENERLFADTNQTVTRNSETARRLAAMGDGKPSEPDLIKQAAAVGGITAVPRAIGIKAADKIMNALMKGRRDASETELARVISGNRNSVVDALQLRERLPKSDKKAEAIARALLLGGGIAGSR